MGQRGPQKTPTAILKLTDSWLAARRPNEPKVESVIPDAPEWMLEECLPRWNRLTKQMHAIGMIGEIDADHLAQYCMLWLQYEQALIELSDYGFIHDDEIKGIKVHPAFKVCMELSTKVMQMGREFGCTPSSRANFSQLVNIKDQKKQAGLEQFKNTGTG